jgi:hypothetical protein
VLRLLTDRSTGRTSAIWAAPNRVFVAAAPGSSWGRSVVWRTLPRHAAVHRDWGVVSERLVEFWLPVPIAVLALGSRPIRTAADPPIATDEEEPDGTS